MSIDLLLVGDGPAVPWDLGNTARCAHAPSAVREELLRWSRATKAEGLLMWDSRLGVPDAVLVTRLLAGRGDLWHAGLALGTGGNPGMIDFVTPAWMLNCDPDTDREATSWRVAINACLVRTSVVAQMGPPCSEFETVEGAMYEWGHRCILRGVLMRHVPALVVKPSIRVAAPSLADEVRFVSYRFGRSWTRWAIARATLVDYGSRIELARLAFSIPSRSYDQPAPYATTHPPREPDLKAARVTVLIPTLHRYKYLRIILDQLRRQTVPPLEIVIVDQTALAERETTLASEFSDLPIRAIFQDEPGQCASRNAGLQMSVGDYILFIDDDDEVPPDLIERHLRNLERFQADVSCGVITEIGTDPLPPDRSFVRASNVFPTGNTLARREVLYRSGLFDLAFNRAPRADGDLGMRVYLSGAFMVLDQSIAALHHRASVGGLRVHHAREITYRMSREQLTRRHLPHISEFYLTARYFTPRQQREMKWMRTVGTLSSHGSSIQKLGKLVVGSLLMPDTISQSTARERTAHEWMTRFPQIDKLQR